MKIIENIIYTIFSVIECLLVFRLLFQVLGANPNNIIAKFIYKTSYPLISPFNGLFRPINFKYFSLDTNVIVAIIIYSIVGYMILEILYTISKRRIV